MKFDAQTTEDMLSRINAKPVVFWHLKMAATAVLITNGLL
jgi:hypothetical protein